MRPFDPPSPAARSLADMVIGHVDRQSPHIDASARADALALAFVDIAERVFPGGLANGGTTGVDFDRDGAPSGCDAHIEPGDDEPEMGGAAFERYFIEAHKYGATRESALKHWATVLSPESRAAWNAGAVAASAAAKVRASAPNALAEALLRAHCDLRWLAGYCGKGSVALSENAAVGFDHAWERSVQNRMLSGKPDSAVLSYGGDNAGGVHLCLGDARIHLSGDAVHDLAAGLMAEASRPPSPAPKEPTR